MWALYLVLSFSLIIFGCNFLIRKEINSLNKFNSKVNVKPKYYSYFIFLIGLFISLTAVSILDRFLTIRAEILLPFFFFLLSYVFSSNLNWFPNPIKSLEKIWKGISSIATILLVIISCTLISILVSKSAEFFQIVTLKDFFSLEWNPQLHKFGAFPVLYGSLMICFLAIIISLPIALLAATFIEEYLPSTLAKIVNCIINTLIAIPSIVYGSFASLYFGPQIKQICHLVGIQASAESALSASITISFMILPFISSFISRAIKALPLNLKEASVALGATKSETIIYIIWPSISSSIMSGTMIALSRVFGETMVVTMAAGLSAQITLNPLESVTTITAQVVTLFTGDQRVESVETLSGFALGLLLLLVSFVLNMLSTYYINKKNKPHA